MKASYMIVAIGVAALTAAFLFFTHADAQETMVEYPPGVAELCKRGDGCVVVPKSSLRAYFQTLADWQKANKEQESMINRLKNLIGKSCA